MSKVRFDLLDPDRNTDERRAAVHARRMPAGLRLSGKRYRPSPALVDAINVSLAVCAPLLLTGAPGTGKTSVAHYVATYFGLELFDLQVRSTTSAEDLFYRFDAVEYLHAANDPTRQPDLPAIKQRILEHGKGPLWKAYDLGKNGRSAVVLLDEIDKASRDFPNDLLHALDQHEFYVREIGEKIPCQGPPPILVITSNSERRLPPPFLRRCIVHHIELTDDLIERAVEAHAEDYQNLNDEARQVALARFLELRRLDLRKLPATAELLAWLSILAARGDVTAASLRVPLRELPALVALIKDHEDYALLG